MGITLIAFGAILLTAQFIKTFPAEFILKWWPIVLIILGIETLAYVYTSKEEEPKVKFDVFSIFMVSLIIFTSLGIYVVTSIFKNADFKGAFPVNKYFHEEKN